MPQCTPTQLNNKIKYIDRTWTLHISPNTLTSSIPCSFYSSFSDFQFLLKLLLLSGKASSRSSAVFCILTYFCSSSHYLPLILQIYLPVSSSERPIPTFQNKVVICSHKIVFFLAERTLFLVHLSLFLYIAVISGLIYIFLHKSKDSHKTYTVSGSE
jgi:hypothetical protein